MKKKIVTMILLVTMICGMAACGQKEETPLGSGQADVQTENNVSEETEQEEKEEVISDEEEWGICQQYIFKNNDEDADGSNVRVDINFLDVIYSTRRKDITGRGDILPQCVDKHAIFVTRTVDWEHHPVDSFETWLEDCYMNTIDRRSIAWDLYYAYLKYDDNNMVKLGTVVPEEDAMYFEIESKELTTINGFQMYKYTGNNVLNIGESTYTIPFVGYTADLQVGEGAWLMWLVLDNREYSNQKDRIEGYEDDVFEEYALKMAKSVKLVEN